MRSTAKSTTKRALLLCLLLWTVVGQAVASMVCTPSCCCDTGQRRESCQDQHPTATDRHSIPSFTNPGVPKAACCVIRSADPVPVQSVLSQAPLVPFDAILPPGLPVLPEAVDMRLAQRIVFSSDRSPPEKDYEPFQGRGPPCV